MGFCGKSIMYNYVVIFKRTKISGLWGEEIPRKKAFKYLKMNSPDYDIYLSIPNKIWGKK